jgi:pSer/pThr/pTyr-binding forkhead associated (FHA) protein
MTLASEDLNSRNKTYVNGQLLAPHQVQMLLHDGDELLLAGLHLCIAFQYG